MRKMIFYLTLGLLLSGVALAVESIIITTPERALEWRTDEPGKMSWRAAKTYCETLNSDVKSIWRLPTVNELQTIIDRSKCRPSADKTIFPHIKPLYYWSFVSRVGDTDSAWSVSFFDGHVGYFGKNVHFNFRCVREK